MRAVSTAARVGRGFKGQVGRGKRAITDNRMGRTEPADVEGAEVASLEIDAGGYAGAVVHIPHTKLALVEEHQHVVAVALAARPKLWRF